jgi:hypothetical protein
MICITAFLVATFSTCMSSRPIEAVELQSNFWPPRANRSTALLERFSLGTRWSLDRRRSCMTESLRNTGMSTYPGAFVRASLSERGLARELDPQRWTGLEDFLHGVRIESAPGVPVA